MNLFLWSGVAVLALVVLYLAIRRRRAAVVQERQDDLPSLHSVVSAFPQHSPPDGSLRQRP